MPLGLLEGGEEEGPGHLVEGGAARVFHPNSTVLPPVETTDGAPLYPGGVGYVDDHPDDRILGTVVLLLGTLGGVSLGGGGGVAVAVLGGLVGLGAGMAFVGRAVVVVGGGVFWAGGSPRRHSRRLERKFSFLRGRLGGGWDAASLGGGGVGAVVVDAPPSPPSSPSLTPPPPMLPHISSSSPPAYPTSCIRAHSLGRKWRDDTQMPLTTRTVSQSWRPRKRARPRGGSRATVRYMAPKDTSWDSSASRQATQMGLAFVALAMTSMIRKKNKKMRINLFGDFSNFSTLILTLNFLQSCMDCNTYKKDMD